MGTCILFLGFYQVFELRNTNLIIFFNTLQDDIRNTEEDFDSRIDDILSDGNNTILDFDDDELTQKDMLAALKEKKKTIKEAVDEALEDACSRLSEAEQNAGEDNAAADPDNQNVTHLSLGFGYGRGGWF